MKLKSILITMASVAGLCSALPASAQFQKPEDAIKYRKAAFTLIGTHFSRIGAMAQGRTPFDGAAAAANAEIVADLAKLPFSAFVDGTSGTDKGTPKANVWTERAKFDEHAKAMQVEAGKLAVAAKANNLDTLKLAFGSTAKTCKSCHDSFRND